MSNRIIKGARRFDVGAVSRVERTSQGYLRCDGRITRTGVFTYRDGRGGIRRELRLPEEVFTNDALESFALAPLTNDHPGEELSAKNTGKFQVGSIVGPRQDGEFVEARIQVTDAKTIDAIEGGKQELSCGYLSDVEETAGITMGIEGVPDGLTFDGIQRNIRGNHVALVDSGRAGPGASLRLDSDDAVLVADEPIKEKPRADAPDSGDKPMKKIRIDGVDYEVSESAFQAITKSQGAFADLQKASEETRTALEGANARADKAEEDLAAEKKAREDAEDPATIRKAIDDRLGIERDATPILGDEVKLDGMTDDEIRSAVVVKTAKDAETVKTRLDGCDPAYLAARYDAAIEAFEPQKRGKGALAAVKKGADAAAHTDSADDARARMIEANFKAGRDELAG